MSSPRREAWIRALLGVAAVASASLLVSGCAYDGTKIMHSLNPGKDLQDYVCYGNRSFTDSGCKTERDYFSARSDYNETADASWGLADALFSAANSTPARAPALPTQQISFAQASSQLVLDFDLAGTTVYVIPSYRQTDGSFTAQLFSVPAPMTSHTGSKLASLPQAQSEWASPYGISSWTPAPHPTRMADTPGTMATSLAIASLGGAPYATVITNPVVNSGDVPSITVWLDSQDTLGQSKIDYPLPYAYPVAVLAADFNGDGKRDVAVLNTGGPSDTNGNVTGTVQVLLGNGNGALGAVKSYGVGARASSMTWADFNHDGRADLAVSSEGEYPGDDSTVTILLGNADGTMHTGNTYDLGSYVDSSCPIVAGDFDGDGKVDLVVFRDGFYLLHGNGDGTFQVASAAGASAPGYQPLYLAAGDFNKDGKLDLAVEADDGTVAILLNAGDGAFPTQSRYVASTPMFAGTSMFAMDFNDDGNLDLVFATGHPDVLYPGSLNLTILFGNGDGTFRNAPAAYYLDYEANDTIAASSMAMADFNGDGLRDLVMAPGVIALGQSGGGLQSPKKLANVSGALFTAADLNGDGHADLVALDGTNVGAYLGNGDGTFQAEVKYAAGPGYPTFVTVGDVNGDGRPDLAVAYGYAGNYGTSIPASILLFTSKSGGGFNPGVTLPTGANTVQVALADVNGDGKLDLIAVNVGQADLGYSSVTPAAGNVTVSLGRGDGTFQAPAAYTVGRNPTSVAVADVNGDGKPDLLVGTITADPAAKIAVLLGKGDGTFTIPTTLIDTYSWPAVLTVADFDGDGKLDLTIVHAAGDSPMTFMSGNGDGTFRPEIQLNAGDTPAAAIAADFTGDGRPDLAVMDIGGEGSGSPCFALFPNTSPASACTYSLSASATPQTIAAAGGTGSFNVIAGTSCDWIAAVSADWIRIAFPSWGTNNGTVNFSVLANTGPARTGTVTVGGKTYTITQAYGGGQLWSIAKSHAGNFTQGQNGAMYTIRVGNSGTGASSGAVTVTETVPAGLTLVYMSGQGWSCPAGGTTCTRSDALNAGANYPDISVVVNVSAGAAASVTNQASVSGGGTSSASASDPTTINPAGTGGTPQAVSVDPAAGNSGYATYTFTFSDSAGWQSISVANVLINNFINGIGACYVAVVPSSASVAAVYLVDDAGDAGGPYQGMTLPGSGTVQNSQCSIAGTGSSVAGSGNTLTVALAITFKTAFAGNKVMYMAAREASGANSGWQALGTCGIPGGSATGPSAGGVTPGRSSGSGAQAFHFTFNDTNGWQDLGVVNVLINDSLDGNQACYLAYSRPYNTLYLVNDAGNGLLPGLTLGASGSLGNGQCTVSGAGSSASGSGNTLTLTLNMSFPASFAGNRLIYLAARSNGDALNSGWQAVGSRTVLPAGTGSPRITVTPSSLDFATVLVGQSATRTFTITNGGGAALTVNAITASAPYSVVSPAAPFTVAAGGTVVTVQFSPSGAGPFTGPYYNLTIASNDQVTPTVAVPLSGTGSATSWNLLPARPAGAVLDTNNPLSANLVGLFLMNEGTGTTDRNLVDGQTAALSGVSPPAWNTGDPSLAFNGGASLNSYLSAGTDSAFDQLPISKMTIVAKMYINAPGMFGICEKDDGGQQDGFLFGMDSSSGYPFMRFLMEKHGSPLSAMTELGRITAGGWMQVVLTWDGTVGTAAALHFYVNGGEHAKTYSNDGSGTLGYAGATNQPFRIGNGSWNLINGSLNGKMAYLAVYKGRILTTAEMTQLDAQLPVR